MKKKLKNIAGVTLIEILIGIVISAIMMGAMFTSYNAVNSVFQQVTDKAKISQSGRDIVGMLLKDIRLAGFKYFGDSLKTSDLHQPILISKSADFSKNCDQIEIVYGDVDYDEAKAEGLRYTYTRYKVTYACGRSEIINKKIPGGKTTIDAFYIVKSKIKWDAATNAWADPNTDSDDTTYPKEKIIDYVQDLIFNAIDENGKIISPPPSTSNNKDKIYKIKNVEIALTVRSTQEFFQNSRIRKVFSLSDSKRDIGAKNDKYLRDTIIVTAYARNLGLQ